MPALGMAQDTGKIVRWLKVEGDQVQAGEPVMEIETDKVTVEIEAPASGVLSGVTAAEGEDVPVGQAVALILAQGETAPEAAPAAEPPPGEAGESAGVVASPVAARMAAEHDLDLQTVKPEGGRVEKSDVVTYLEGRGDGGTPSGRALASPKARRLASERGLDLKGIRGSGPGGAVLAEDVLSLEPAAAQEAATPAAFPLSDAWRVMAQRVTQSWTETPHFYLLREARADRLIAWRERVQPKTDENITYTDLLVRLAAVALREHPRLNASWRGGTVQPNDEIAIGLAVAVEDGLIVPVIHHADRLGLEEIAARRAQIVERANAGRMRAEDLQGGTFTISNLGMYGVDAFNAILNPPQAAILAVGRIAERFVPVEGQPAIRPMMMLSLSCDHRVVDGARGAEFLSTLVELIEEPLGLLH